MRKAQLNSWSRRLVRQLVATRWNVGFLDVTDMETVISGNGPAVRWLKHSFRDRWFADPFILTVNDDTIELLVEEWVDGLRRGRISKLVVDRATCTLKSIVPLLDTGSHLSFPAIREELGEIFVYPESSVAGDCAVYRYDRQREALDRVSTLIDVPVTDAILFPERTQGRFWLLSTRQPNPSGSVLDIYAADEWHGNYAKHSTLELADRSARNAGAIFKFEGAWVRPAQDCNRRYGHGLVFQRLDFDGSQLSLIELGRRFPQGTAWKLGIHTFNVAGGLAVVDGHAWRTPVVGSMLSTLRVGKLLARLQRSAKGEA